MRDSHSSSWKEPYLEALRESDKEKLTELVYAAEGAIFLRLQELARSADHHEERSEIDAACAALLSIQINKLGFPLALPERVSLFPIENRADAFKLLRKAISERPEILWTIEGDGPFRVCEKKL
jgi:hypothetical protein